MRNIYVLVLLSSISSSFISVSADPGQIQDENTAHLDNTDTRLGKDGHGIFNQGGMPGANGHGIHKLDQSSSDS